MKKYYPVLQKCPLFSGISEQTLYSMLDCLSAWQKNYAKNSFAFLAGGESGSLGIVLSGAIHILQEDFWGKRKIVARIEAGGLFGEAFACAGTEKLPVSAMAAEKSEVLFLNVKRVIKSCKSSCVFHADLIKNLMLLLARKNIELVQKLEYVTRPNTREKLLAYLSEQARLAGKNTFNIPFNREELADYLSVERSAMSAELSRMRDEGLIVYKKNHFELTTNSAHLTLPARTASRRRFS